jgi:SNF2 family DNA or RNA helicase
MLSYNRATADLRAKVFSLDFLMRHMENLEHEPAPYIEGLTVALLTFQQQTLQWAIERELTPGGIQSYFRPKLPSVDHPSTDVYYCPVTGTWTTEKPRLVRGGIIAEQMGLGKLLRWRGF